MAKRAVLAIALLTIAVTGCGLVNPRPLPGAETCAEWSVLNADQQIETAEAVTPSDLLPSVRERQHLAPDTTSAALFAAVASSFTKVCEIERRPELLLSEIVASLYR